MQLKRALFVPGRRIEQIGKLGEQRFFTRRPADSTRESITGSPLAPPRRGLLPRLAENAGALFSVTLSVILVVALIALVVAFVRELRQDSVLLESFVAPKDLVEQGYTSTVIAEKMLDEIRAINRGSDSVRARRALEFGDAVPDIQIAHGGLSMKSIVRYARRLFDLPDATIGGEIVRRGTPLRMTIRTRDRYGTQVVEVVRDDADADALLRDAGRAIVRATDPYILATYFNSKESDAGSETFPETLAAIDYVLTHPPESDDAWALNLRGNVRMEQGRPEAATCRLSGCGRSRRDLSRESGAGVASGRAAGRSAEVHTGDAGASRRYAGFASRLWTGAAEGRRRSRRDGRRSPDGEPFAGAPDRMAGPDAARGDVELRPSPRRGARGDRKV